MFKNPHGINIKYFAGQFAVQQTYHAISTLNYYFTTKPMYLLVCSKSAFTFE